MDPPDHDESAQPSSNAHSLLCRICNKPVRIETARIDSNGKAIHEDCYVHEISDSDGHAKHEKRSWLAIAKELSEEQNSVKFSELANELTKALDDEEAESHPSIQKMQDR